MKSSEVLKEVKERLWSGYGHDTRCAEYICHNLENIMPDAWHLRSVKDAVRSHLNGQDSYASTLRNIGLVPSSLIHRTQAYCVWMQSKRQELLDVLIAEFEAKGD